jgi:hypothetical protein
VGAVTALAAMHKPSNNALREDFIKRSFLMSFGYPSNQTYCLNGTAIWSVDRTIAYVGLERIFPACDWLLSH